jgi:ATP-dependent exoDNAse (exonuclease V) beta subunit
MTTAPRRTCALDHTVVLASAGTGKTFALTSRYIALLACGVEPDRILASTFTRKAAGEILRKVVERLADGAACAKAASELGAQCTIAGLTRDRCLQLLTTLTRRLDRAAVGTLDSFMMQVVGAMALELDGGGGGLRRLIEDDEDHALRDVAVAEVLASCDRAEALALLRLLSPGKVMRSVHRALRRAIDAACAAFLRSSEDAWATITAPAGLGDVELGRAMRRLEALVPPSKADGSPNSTWEEAMDSAVAAAKRSDWCSFVGAGIAFKIVEGEDTFARREIPPEVRRVYQPLIRHAAAALIGEIADRNRATRRFLVLFHEAYTRLKAERAEMTFDDLPRLILASGGAEDLDRLAYRLDARHHHILLDEFQDTSLDQWRMLRPLCEEVVANRPPQRTFFCVGDTKQSLYGWRNAEPWLLPGLPKTWPQLIEQTLSTSFRSSPPVIDAVNRIMGSLDRNPAMRSEDYPRDMEAARQWASQWAKHETEKTDLPGSVRLRTAPQAEDKDEQPEVRLTFAAARIAEIHKASPHARIGVLFRRKRNIALMRHELKKQGIDASEEGGNPLTDSPAVAAALSMLTFADHPGHTAARYHAAASPLGAALGMAPDVAPARARAAASRVRRSILEHGYAGALESWRRLITPGLGRRDAQRFDQLIELGELFDARQVEAAASGGSFGAGALRPSEFVELVRLRHVEDPSGLPVRLMTIHASKGLEFDCVVLADLDYDLVRFPSSVIGRRAAQSGRGEGMLDVVTVAPRKCVLGLDENLKNLHAGWRIEQIGEELCVLYVALTRARHALELIIDPSDKPDLKLSPAGLLRGALAPGAAAPKSVLFTLGDPGWHQHPNAPKPPEAGAAAPALEAGPPRLAATAGRSRLRARHSPSSLARAGAEGSHALPASLVDGGAAAMARGQIVHAWLELIPWLEDGVPDDAALAECARRVGVPPGVDLVALMARFRESLRDRSVVDALSRQACSDRLGRPPRLDAIREMEFALDSSGAGDAGPSLLSGRFDRLIVARAREGGPAFRAEVIDFKTDAIDTSDPQAVAERVELYRPQLDAYQRAAAQLLSIDPASVDARLVFVSLADGATERSGGRAGRPTP